jgi:hypothetical protein
MHPTSEVAVDALGAAAAVSRDRLGRDSMLIPGSAQKAHGWAIMSMLKDCNGLQC